jgi:hypothetical protein
MASRNLWIWNLERQGGYRYVADVVSAVNAFRRKRLLYALFWVIHTYPPMETEQAECSETLECKLQTPVNHPEESIQHSQHGESLKSGKVRLLW